MTEQYEVAWTPTAKRALQRLPEQVATAAVEFVYGPLAKNPHRVDKMLRFELAGLHSARRGDYRIIYRIDERFTITAIDHRDRAPRRRLPLTHPPWHRRALRAERGMSGCLF